MTSLTTMRPLSGLGELVRSAVPAAPSAALAPAHHLVNEVVVPDAPELILPRYPGPARPGSWGIGTTVLCVRPNSLARIPSDLLPVPGLQVVHT